LTLGKEPLPENVAPFQLKGKLKTKIKSLDLGGGWDEKANGTEGSSGQDWESCGKRGCWVEWKGGGKMAPTIEQ